MNKKLALSALIVSASLLSTAALAHGRDRDEWRDHRHKIHPGWRHAPVYVVYAPPRPVYVRPPVVYYPPAYYAQPIYAPVAVRHVHPRAYYHGYHGDRFAGQVIGAVAGGAIGHVIGHGGLAPTAIGAVVGGVVGGSLAD